MDDLRKLAEEATPGPWLAPIGRMGVDALAAERPGLLIGAICAPSRNDVVFVERYEDMEFVAAANPTVVLDLLNRIGVLVTALQPLLEARHNHAHNGDIVEGGPFGEGCPFCAPIWDLIENRGGSPARSSSKVETGVEK